eukprot:m.18088 g.18088  ORF g.18088 m.18088 type:complete len:719 (+) comp3564_c0_seq1:134-2290(+)
MPARPPGWLGHDMSPREPYTRVHGHYPVDMIEPPHEQPATGPRCHVKKGFFNNPDFDQPRKPPTDPMSQRHPKVESISAKAPMPPAYRAGEAAAWMTGKSAPGRINHVYGRTVDQKWEKLEDFPRLHSPAMHAKQDFIRSISEEERVRHEVQARQKALDQQPPLPSKCAGPWADTRVRLQMQPSSEPHPRKSLTKQQRRFEEENSPGTFVGLWAGKAGAGAPNRRPDGTVNPYISTHFDIHAHNDINLVGNTGTFEGRELSQQARIRADLDRQVADNRERRMLSRAREEERIVLDDGGLGQMGTKTSPPKGVVHHGFNERPQPNRELGRTLREQAREQRSMRDQERTNARSNDVGYQPFGKDHRQKRERYARVHATKPYGMADPSMAPVDGGSLVNVATWGTPGGGAQIEACEDGRPHVLRHPFRGEEEKAEIDAQARGESIWGRPGAGAANRNPDGTIKFNVQGAAERDISGVADARRGPEFRCKKNQLRHDQAEFMRQKEEQRKLDKEADVLADQKGNELLMLQRRGADDFNDKIGNVYDGKGRYHRHKMEPEYSTNGSPTRAHRPDYLKEQIEMSKERRAMEREREDHDNARHLKAAAAQFPNSDRVNRPTDPITHEPTGRLPLDPMIHMQEFQGRLRLTSDEKHEYKEDLDKAVEERQAYRESMRERKLQEELKHAKTMEQSWQPAYRKQDGRRRIRPSDTEYKMLVHNAPPLA